MKKSDLEKISRVVGFEIENKQLFLKAFTHKTRAFQSGDLSASNERLEFLGDSVLNLYISVRLFNIFPDAAEGVLTRMRSYLVNTRQLAKLAKDLGLQEILKVGDSFEGEPSEQTSVLADTFEALLGAVYIDKGWEAAGAFIEKYFDIEQASDKLDSKSKLQQIVQKKYGVLPQYNVVSEEGLPHKKQFIVEVEFNGKIRGEGSGSNKKSAQDHAAKAALEKLTSPASKSNEI
ncbi:ribonuclease III [bacterium]|nr:ribonuclease III [bacterium]MBU3955729.1 ribonuclease III [bacterium]